MPKYVIMLFVKKEGLKKAFIVYTYLLYYPFIFNKPLLEARFDQNYNSSLFVH